MLSLTLWQPWAHAIVHLGKRVENRPWAPPTRVLGQVIAIHAGAKYDADAWSFPPGVRVPPREETPLRAVVGVARLLGALDVRDTVGPHRLRHTIGDHPRLSGLDRDPWWSGPVGWLLEDVYALPKPVPANGARRLWALPVEVEAAVRSQLPEVPW